MVHNTEPLITYKTKLHTATANYLQRELMLFIIIMDTAY
jgi:hypothetical protein